MTQQAMERALGKLLTDENFRERFFTIRRSPSGGSPSHDRALMSEQIVQQPAFERQKPETNSHTSVANGHTSSAPAPAPARNVLSRHQITVLDEQLRQNEIGVARAVFYVLARRATRRMQVST